MPDYNNSDQNFTGTETEFTYTGQIDSQRGRAAYSSAEKAMEQFNTIQIQRSREQAYQDDQRNRNLQQAHTEAEFRARIAQEEHAERLRQQQEAHEQRMRHQETEHQLVMQQWGQNQVANQGMQLLMMRLLSGGITNDKVGAEDLLENVASLMAKTNDLTPPARTTGNHNTNG